MSTSRIEEFLTRLENAKTFVEMEALTDAGGELLKGARDNVEIRMIKESIMRAFRRVMSNELT